MLPIFWWLNLAHTSSSYFSFKTVLPPVSGQNGCFALNASQLCWVLSPRGCDRGANYANTLWRVHTHTHTHLSLTTFICLNYVCLAVSVHLVLCVSGWEWAANQIVLHKSPRASSCTGEACCSDTLLLAAVQLLWLAPFSGALTWDISRLA